ncbi:MAG: redoxin domain-containing protein [Leptospira sp.]|nr:redoxin domain-containing protein [Leptospira sp.]
MRIFKCFIVTFLVIFLQGNNLWAFEEYTKEKFSTSQKNNERILLHFHAEWCPTCKSQAKALDSLELEGKLKGIKIYRVDFDKEDEFKSSLKVSDQSTFVAFYGGPETGRIIGITSKDDINQFITQKLRKISLSEQLDLMQKQNRSKLPEDKRKIMDASLEKLKASKIEEKAPKLGQVIQNFQLTDTKGKRQTLDSLLKKGPVVVSFFRGSWCPYCNAQLKNYQEYHSQFKAKNATLVAITPETTKSLNDKNFGDEFDFIILQDTKNQYSKKLGLVFGLDESIKKLYKEFGIDLEKDQNSSEWELPLPATFVVGKNRKILYSFVSADYTKRANPEEILLAIPKK